MTAQTIDINFQGRQHTLHVEQDAYNGYPAYYIVDENLSSEFNCDLPDNLVLFETDAGMECSPRVVSLECRRITEEIWKAIKAHEADTPQPFGPGLG
ncbi:hypothetical protein [Chitinophaga japonensis]|uniref:Uncharacterized protein n=1 Tax=Chitinophaga japonensis TaxID=104662 RepID=A0A562T0N6_CHIJA|nr:hypothetical protein [Chitinophaga japonensis]TWI86636.1 hypothetical protein LX66_3898 [Chitinophaga japonensis]